MTLSQPISRDLAISSPPPSPAQLLLFLLLLGWLAAVPIGLGIVSIFLPPAWPEIVKSLLTVVLLTVLLLIPFAGFWVWVRRPRREGLRPLALVLLGVGLYISLDTAIRAIAGPGNDEATYLLPLRGTILRLALLTPTALLLGSLGLGWAEVPGSRRELGQGLGLGAPRPIWLLLALTGIAVLTVGWPLTGALGDRWVSQMLLIQSLAQILPEELFFRGAVLGLLLTCFPHRRILATVLALLIYVAFTPSLLLPHHDWSKVALLLTIIPLTGLLVGLRLWSSTIWAGLLVAWCYRSAPLLFTDPRDDLPLITQPWQTAAYLWMILAAAILAGFIWAGRRWLAPPRSALAAAGLVLVAMLIGWGVWLGLWWTLGRPGFYDDGFLIIMADQADLSGAEQIADLPARRAFVRDRLIETANRGQAPVRQALDTAGLAYRPFYLINMIRVEGHHRRMAEFADLPGVARVMLNPNVRPYPFHFDIGYGATPNEGQGVEASLSQVYADQVWELGFTGQGIVVGGQDTGYDWQHPALRPAYRGVNAAGEVNHNYNWHDAWADTSAPFDDDQHGTHTMGTILGDDGQGNQIGMAPGARWIGCRNMQRGLGNPASYTDCMEFFLAPYPLNGDPFRDGDVSKAPDVVNNSWGCPDVEGCDDTVLEPATAALQAAGMMMVVSVGNDGPACGTANEPPARYARVFSVGASNAQGQVTGFSSRGPVAGPGQSPLLKPDITAPGDNIRSSLPGGGYGTASGTSMAGPHVAGLVALIWSANPALIGQIEATEEIIRQSATPVSVEAACPPESQPTGDALLLGKLDSFIAGNACACGGVTGSPNNVYGWGQIDALRAVQLALAEK
jgi:subtilisin family serine protease